MTVEMKHRLRVAAVPGVPLLVYGLCVVVAISLLPPIQRSIKYLLRVPLCLLVAWYFDVLARLAEETLRETGQDVGPFRVARWGARMAFCGMALTYVLAGIGFVRSYDLVGLGIAIFGAFIMIAGGVWAIPGQMRIWRLNRRIKRGG